MLNRIIRKMWTVSKRSNFILKFPDSQNINYLYIISRTLYEENRTSLVAQWLRIRLPMQGTRVRAPVQEDPTCRGATTPVRHNYRACALEPASHNYWARAPQLLKACTPACRNYWARTPRARALQQEKPPQWEVHTPQRRVPPAHRN